MPQSDPLIFVIVLIIGLASILSATWAVTSVIRDTTMSPLARVAVLAVLVLLFPVAGLLWLLAKATDLPSRLGAPLTFSGPL